MDRNRGVHEGKRGTGLEIVLFVKQRVKTIYEREPPQGATFKLNFDAAYDRHQSVSASGVMVRDAQGEIRAEVK